MNHLAITLTFHLVAINPPTPPFPCPGPAVLKGTVFSLLLKLVDYLQENCFSV